VIFLHKSCAGIDGDRTPFTRRSLVLSFSVKLLHGNAISNTITESKEIDTNKSMVNKAEIATTKLSQNSKRQKEKQESAKNIELHNLFIQISAILSLWYDDSEKLRY
jgi:hypothetical protein